MRSYAVDRYRGVDLGWDGIFKKLIRELKKDNPSVLLLDAQQKAGALYVYVARSGPPVSYTHLTLPTTPYV